MYAMLVGDDRGGSPHQCAMRNTAATVLRIAHVTHAQQQPTEGLRSGMTWGFRFVSDRYIHLIYDIYDIYDL